VKFEGNNEEGFGPRGIMAPRTLTASVGQPLELAIDVRDQSVRDRSDARFKDDIALRVIWSKYQGPVGGQVTFTRHPSTPAPEPAGRGRGGRGAAAPDSTAGRA